VDKIRTIETQKTRRRCLRVLRLDSARGSYRSMFHGLFGSGRSCAAGGAGGCGGLFLRGEHAVAVGAVAQQNAGGDKGEGKNQFHDGVV
jgi:hypothetical protein